jgi:hypothetical protein
VYLSRLILLFVLPFFAACSDQRATFEINGGTHSLSLIRITNTPWAKTAEYAVVASHMPDCTRRHAMSDAGLNTKVEVFAPGNDAWILRQGTRMYVVETRTCEGFAKLSVVPESGIGSLMGAFEMRGGNMVFVAAPKVQNVSAAVSTAVSAPVSADTPKR